MYESINAESRLSYLLAMEQVEVDADLAKYRGHLGELIEDIRFLLHQSPEKRTSAIEARIAHLRMIQAHGFCEDATLPVDIRTFYAALGAERIAQDVGFAASVKGIVALLSREMEGIRSREGLTGNESWTRGEGPPDFQELASRQKEILKRIEDTVVPFLLWRYRLDEYADLYERDRVTFEVQREVGRILMMEGGSPPAATTLLNSYIGITCGREAVQRVLSRLRRIRNHV